MRFYTQEEFESWLSGRGRIKPDLIPGVRVERIVYPPNAHRLFFIAHWVATTLTYGQSALLLITEWGYLGKQRELAFILQVASNVW